MGKINAVITGVGGYVPDYILNNEELSRMVDTTDEWITTRVGIKERRILTEEGLGTSYLARKAAKQLIQKTGVDPDTIDALIVTTTTPDYKFPWGNVSDLLRRDARRISALFQNIGQVLIIQDHIVPNELPIRFFPVKNLENQKIHHRPYDRRLHAKALCMAKAATRIGPLSLK